MTNKKRGGKKHKKPNSTLPFVSICTPTFNRRPFITHMIKCFEHQDYPKNRMEWIIIDDGTDKIEELVTHIPQVKYFKYDKKMSLGEKRNLMHTKTCGEILVYMDDDDYYPPERVSHAVEMLQTHPDALCAGSSICYIYFKHIDKIIQFGPYGPKHGTAGTFAFKRKLLKDHAYENSAALAEERAFLKNYTVPFVQLDPVKTILVFSHEHNTFDKRKLLENPHPDIVRESGKKVETIVKDCEMRDFYMNQVEELLKTYEPGKPSMKPDVLKQIIEIEERRRKQAETMAQNMANVNNKCIIIKKDDGESHKLTLDETLQLLQQQQNTIQNLTQQLKGKELEIDLLDKTHQTELNEKNERSIIMSDNNGVKTPLSLEQVAYIIKNQKMHIINITNNLQKKDDEVNELREKLQKAENNIEILQNITSMKESENIYLKITENETTIDNIE
jgi:glycosyltransferase involved in cell wall biosynthesis